MTQLGSGERALLLLSGGLDSAVCLAELAASGIKTECLWVGYGQEAGEREDQASRRLCEFYGVKRWSVHLPKGLGLPYAGPSIQNPKSKIQNLGIHPNYLPGRNAILISLGLAYAERFGIPRLVIGTGKADGVSFPDGTGEFLIFAGAMIAVASGRRVDLENPLFDLWKPAIVKRAIELNVPIDLTWSCYRSTTTPCTDCKACEMRAYAFEEAGVFDPSVLTRENHAATSPVR